MSLGDIPDEAHSCLICQVPVGHHTYHQYVSNACLVFWFSVPAKCYVVFEVGASYWWRIGLLWATHVGQVQLWLLWSLFGETPEHVFSRCSVFTGSYNCGWWTQSPASGSSPLDLVSQPNTLWYRNLFGTKIQLPIWVTFLVTLQVTLLQNGNPFDCLPRLYHWFSIVRPSRVCLDPYIL